MFFKTWAENTNKPIVNVVAVLVDDKIYSKIQDDLKWYASEYIQQKLTDTKALVMPLDLNNISSYDIYRMMENIYFDWLEDVNSSLVWLVMVWDIPLPVVNQDGYIFPTVYPYVDFENQKYVWDDNSKYFVPNGNVDWQAEIWHWLINYWDETGKYTKFFNKVKKYYQHPDSFISDGIWYEDFIASKEWFLWENFKYYRNHIMFWEDIWYQRYTPLMKKLFNDELSKNAVDIVSDLGEALWTEFSWWDSLSGLWWSEWMHSTKLVQQEIETSFLADYNDLFSYASLSTMRENVFAGWRWIKTYDWSGWKSQIANSDSSAAKIQMKDTLYLWNESMEWLLQSWNDALESMIDNKIDKEKYSMDIVIPVQFEEIEGKRIVACHDLLTRYENYYFWKDARYIDDAKELSIYRWTYRNLDSLKWLTYNTLLSWKNPVKSSSDKTNVKLKSIWASYDIFSTQVEWNRWYNSFLVAGDLDVFDANKEATQDEDVKICLNTFCTVRRKSWPSNCGWGWKKDKTCEDLNEFAKRRWWWATPVNLDDKGIKEWTWWRYVLSWFKATDSWRSMYNMWGFQALLQWNDEGDSGKWWINWQWKWPQTAATSFKAYIKYASPTQIDWWEKTFWWWRIFSNHMSDTHTSFSKLNYWNLGNDILNWNFSKSSDSDKMFTISTGSSKGCWWSKKYTYKFLNSVIKHDSTNEDEINWIDYDMYWDSWEAWNNYANILNAYISVLNSITWTYSVYWTINNRINGNIKTISGWKTIEDVTWVNKAISDMNKIISSTKDDLSSLQNWLWSIWLVNIVSVYEKIIDRLWMKLSDYTWSYSNSLPKIELLSSWMSDIKTTYSAIKTSWLALISGYNQAISWIKNEISLWQSRATEFKTIDWVDWNKVDNVTANFSADIFTIVTPEKEITDWMSSEDLNEFKKLSKEEKEKLLVTHLDTLWTDFKNTFDSSYKEISNIVDNLVKADLTGAKIIEKAKSDSDFKSWIKKNNVILDTDAELITAYARWAAGDWYDSAWAKANHDLLQWVISHESWINILTPDRPIDSPRYVSMQSIAGNEIKFIYPDLFKVEVFNSSTKNWVTIHELKTIEEIKKSLISYLSWKVDEYNSILKSEYNSRKSTNDKYFSKLSGFDPLATPTISTSVRPYGYFKYSDFVEAIWWSGALDTIAEILYYQSLTNKQKNSSDNIESDIENIKKSFDINDRRAYVLKSYLTEWNTWWMFIVPTYNATWYEVAYVNSDGWDYIVTSWSTKKSVEDATQTVGSARNSQNKNNGWKDNDPCSQYWYWGDVLPLFEIKWWKPTSPWYEWFKCWLNNLKVDVSISFDHSLWEIFDSWFTWYVKNSWLWAWWDQVKQFFTWKETDSSMKNSQLSEDANSHNQEVLSWGGWVKNALSNLNKYVKINNSKANLSLEMDSESELTIWSLSDVWTIKVSFTSTWDGCLSINWHDTCGKSYDISFNPKTNPFKWIVKSKDHKAWSVALDMKMYLWNGSDYIERVEIYTVQPWTLNEVNIISNDKTIAWMTVGFEIVWFDEYKNQISWSLDNYEVTASTWTILKDWAYFTWFITNNFKELHSLYYSAPADAINNSIATIQVKDVKSWKVMHTRNITIMQWYVKVKLDGKEVITGKAVLGSGSYRLLQDESIYSNGNLNVNKLHKIDVDLYDVNNRNFSGLNSQIYVTSRDWLVVIWSVVKEDWKNVFKEGPLNTMSWWHAIIYYYPTTVAWNDQINIQIPWLDTRVINLSILPWQFDTVKTLVTSDVLTLGKSMDFEVMATDKWGNFIDSAQTLNLVYDKSKIKVSQETIKLSESDKWYKKITIQWIWAWLSEVRVTSNNKWDWKYITVDDHLFPSTWLNVLYLNYFGNDWWNQWWYFSDNNKYIEYVMSNSNKIVSTTTQLVSEKKIKKLVWKVELWFKLWNPNNLSTSLLFDSGKARIMVWDVAKINISLWDFEWWRSSSSELVDYKSIDKNTIIFIPIEWSNYKVDKGVLYSWDSRLWDINLWDVYLQLSNETLENGYNIWNVVNNGTTYWTIVIHMPKFVPTEDMFSDVWERYLINSTFVNWSTANLSGVWIFDRQSDFALNTSYKSIQNSDELSERIWFLWDFKNITLFAEWESVWDATKKFWSELLINLWDPVLSLASKNEKVYWTKFDWWIWNEIFVDTEDDIFGTYQIDFNNDWYKDLLVIYRNGAVKLAKNYWWALNLRNLQWLMFIAVWIEKVFIWDVDGNGYEDIVIRTDNNQFRVYWNEWGIFDVDWKPVCLNMNVESWAISQTPSNIWWAYKIFVEDMNKDKYLDIVTYDHEWFIKVFYWGFTKQYANYVSKDKAFCDSWWYDRQKWNIVTVTQLWLQISSSDKVYDNSMLHWEWLKREEIEITEKNASDFWVDIDVGALSGLIQEKDRDNDVSISAAMGEIMDNFDVDKATDAYVWNETKYHDITLNETTLLGGTWNNYIFVPISYLVDDVASVWKTYSLKYNRWWILKKWDLVTVTVNIKANKSFKWAYWDVIQWPWKVYYNGEGIFKGIQFYSNKKNSVVKQEDWWFAYIIDNISLRGWETLVYKYDLEYDWLPVRDVYMDYSWKYPSIKLQSIDWCEKNYDLYENITWKNFKKKVVKLQDDIDRLNDEVSNNTEDLAGDISNAWSDYSQIPWLIWEKMSRINLLLWWISVSDDDAWKNILKDMFNGWAWIDLWFFDEQTAQIESVIDDITKWMCEWFDFGWSHNCEWLPVPFNEWFLWPWQYHLFWCWNIPTWPLENWIPVFHFPWTLPTPVGTIPFPRWQKWPWDEFIWVPWWVYPSMIRIYAVPTLTLQVWIAICLWPYWIWSLIPSPLADIGGNCVVFAIKPQCKGKEWQQNDDSPEVTYDPVTEDVQNSWICQQTQKWPLVTWKWWQKAWVSSPLLAVDWSSVLWIIEFEASAIAWGVDWSIDMADILTVWDVDILWWTFTKNRIRWWIQQWLRKIIVDKWLDPQIRYIANQLTKMHVTIRLPDVFSFARDEIWAWSNIIDNFAGSFSGYGKDIASNLNFDTSWFKDEDWNAKWENTLTWVKTFVGDQSSIQNLSQSLNNPFESLSLLLNQSNLLNIQLEPVTVKIPWLTSEDINSYQVQLTQWIEVNTWILAEWKNALITWWNSCWKLADSVEKQKCYEEKYAALSSFIEFEQSDWPRFIDQIYSNIRILQEYRQFPFEVYERIHVIDKYVYELSTLINNTYWYLFYWLSTNVNRASWYIDAITLMLNIIKTYQLIIDFSVEWSETCGNCAEDTYDQYSCKLSFLCDLIELPIIQIPNFKLPNITIDLSSINMWLNVILPKFNFQTVGIELPSLPNLPEPPTFGINIKLFDLPEIPQLPSPPTLPELPTFIPEINMELPILPPAPELPKIPDKIELVIKAASLIGKIYCIVKWGFWLVWEKSVKARVEQMTQRTYSVKWIDTIMDFTNFSAAPIKNYGVDYEISTDVNFQFSFDEFYALLNWLTQKINKYTTMPFAFAESWLNYAAKWLDIVSDYASIVSNWVDIDLTVFDLDKSDWNSWLIWYKSADLEWLTTDEVEYVDYESAKNRLEEVLAFFRAEWANTNKKDRLNSSISKIEDEINVQSDVEVNYDWINSVKNDAIAFISNQQKEYDDLANFINEDYDWFLAMVRKNELNGVETRFGSSYDSWKVIAFNAPLFNLDYETQEAVKKIQKENPYLDILDNKKEIVDWFWRAVNTNTADTLWMSQSQYLVLRDSIWSAKKQISSLYSVVKPVQSTKLVSKKWDNVDKTLTVATTSVWGNTTTQLSIDPAWFAKWIYETILSWKNKWRLVKVVYSDLFTSDIWSNHYKTAQTWDHDIILWDENVVYMKCGGTDLCNPRWNHFGNYYEKAVKEIPNQETWISFDGETKLKIADSDLEVKNWRVQWQTFDSLSFSWRINGTDAYLIKLVDRVDYSYEKQDYNYDKWIYKPIYVLVLPDTIDVSNLDKWSVKVELYSSKRNPWTIDELMSWWDLVEIVSYDTHKSTATITISNIDRKWYYARIASLTFNDWIFNITSPWSNQIVAWKQILGDDEVPFWEWELVRESTNEIVGEWESIEAYIWTYYTLNVNWEDNVALSYINVSKDWELLAEKYTTNTWDVISVTGIIRTKKQNDVYVSEAIDQFGNKTESKISVSYMIPDIEVTDIQKMDDWSVVIMAELSQDIDQWNVSFQRRRWESWKTMRTSDTKVTDFELWPRKSKIEWKVYSIWTDIALYDKNDEVIALMDANTAEIKVQDWYKDKVTMEVRVDDASHIWIFNDDKLVFSISLPTKEFVKLEVSDKYLVKDISNDWTMWIFGGWKVVAKDWIDILYISNDWYLHSEIWLEWTYEYDRELQSIKLTLYLWEDLKKINPIKVWLKVDPFVLD